MANNYQPFNRSLLAMAALQALPLSLFAQNTGEKPNILYIMCDDHAIQAISAYGSAISQLAPTPNIDRLAERGMKFNEAFVENSLSTPSRACLMTGLYSHQNGQRMLAEGIDSTKTFFSEMLQKAGYETAVVGKWHMSCRPKGFDFYHILNILQPDLRINRPLRRIQAGNGICHRPHHRPCHRIPRPKRQKQAILSAGSS